MFGPDAFSAGSFAAMQELTKKNFAAFNQALAMFSPFAGAKPAAELPAKKANSEDDIDELRTQLSDMQKKLESLRQPRRAEPPQKRSLRARISANTAAGSAPGMPTAAWTDGSSARRNGLAASSAAIVVGKVGRPSARSRATSSTRAFKNRIAGLDGDGEPAVRLRVFMAAIDFGLAGKGGKLHERAPHDRVGRLEHAAAPEREQRVAAEGDLVLVEMIGDVPERMSRRLDHFRRERADAGEVAFGHPLVEKRNPRRVLGRSPHPQIGELRLQLRNALNVVGVMMGDEDVGQSSSRARRAPRRSARLRARRRTRSLRSSNHG